MQAPRLATALACALILVAAGCTLPRSGPTANEIKSAGDIPELGMHLVTVTPAVAAASRSSETLGFGSELVNAGVISPDTISPGDTALIQLTDSVEEAVNLIKHKMAPSPASGPAAEGGENAVS